MQIFKYALELQKSAMKFSFLCLKVIFYTVKFLFKPCMYILQAFFSYITTLFNLIFNKNKDTNAINTLPVEYASIDRNGFIFGKYGTNYIVKKCSIDGHILVIGGSGRGKSSCLAIPSLQVWEERVFAVDIKGELYNKSKNNRANIKILNPVENKNIGYDVYFALKSSTNLIQSVQDIVLSLLPISPDIKDPFWLQSAQNILSSAIIYCYMNNNSFIETLDFILKVSPDAFVDIIDKSSNSYAKMYINSLKDIDTRTLSGIYTELSNKIISLVTDTDLCDCLSNTIDVITPEMLEYGYDIYLQIDETKLNQWGTFLNLIITQFLSYFEKRSESCTTAILFLLDEFARLGKINNILNALATLRSKKVTICILIQSLSQLDLIYSKTARQVICDNCQFKVILNATDADTQKYFSDLIGTYDKIKYSSSTNYDFLYVMQSHSKNVTTEEKKIIKSEQPASLGNSLILLSPKGNYLIKKNPYYL